MKIKQKEGINTFEYTYFVNLKNEGNPIFNNTLELAELLSNVDNNFESKRVEQTLKYKKLIDASLNRPKVSKVIQDKLNALVLKEKELKDYQYSNPDLKIDMIITESKKFLALIKEANDSKKIRVKNFYISFRRSIECFKQTGHTILQEQIEDINKLELILSEEIFLKRNQRNTFNIFVAVDKNDMVDMNFLVKMASLISKYEFRIREFVTFILCDGLKVANNDGSDMREFQNKISSEIKQLEEIYNQTNLSELNLEIISKKNVLNEYKNIYDLIYDLQIKADRKQPSKIGSWVHVFNNLHQDKFFFKNINRVSVSDREDLREIIIDLEQYDDGANLFTNLSYFNSFIDNYDKRIDLCIYFMLFSKFNGRHSVNRNFTIPTDFFSSASDMDKETLLLFVKINLLVDAVTRIILIDDVQKIQWIDKNFVYIKPNLFDNINKPKLYLPYVDKYNRLVIKIVRDESIERSIESSIISSTMDGELIDETNIEEFTDRLNLDKSKLDEIESDLQHLMFRFNMQKKS